MYGLEFDLGNNVRHVELHFVPTQVTLLLPGRLIVTSLPSSGEIPMVGSND